MGTVLRAAFWISAAGITLTVGRFFAAQASAADVPDISGQYEFLTPDNTLAILEEDGKLHGYIDVFQGENESDAILSYNITIGSREKDHIEFRTQKIHEKYYRFSGTVERGRGHAPGDADYLRLVGRLETIVDNSVTGRPQVETAQVVFKSKSRTAEKQ